MKHRRRLLIVLTAILVIGSQIAYGGALRTSQGRATPTAAHGTAFAALQPVGAATGWGRVVVRDADLPSGPKRTVQVWLFGMEPHTEYLIAIDGVDIGVIFTRSSGSGVLKLQNDGRGHEPVPEDLPPAGELAEVIVDGPEGPTLEGSFAAFTHPGGQTIYEEEIELEDVSGGDAGGMAKVEMKEEGHQEFKTCATGLEPDSSYTVIVDGFTVAVVTTDGQGQACVKLEEPDDDNPLPPELLPVSGIETVEWRDADGNPILRGVFTGAGACADLVGTVTGFTADGFLLETAEETVAVVVTDDTVWQDFGDHEIAVGDKVKVEGCRDGDDFVAEKIELCDGDDDSCGKYVGIITDVSGEAFVLDTDEGPISVVTTGETDWIDFGDHTPSVGDKVKVSGCWDGEVFTAMEVELMDGGGPENRCTQVMGVVTEMTADGFSMRAGNTSVPVLIASDTEYVGFGDHQLGVGDKVKVEGCWDGDVLVAAKVELKKAG